MIDVAIADDQAEASTASKAKPKLRATLKIEQVGTVRGGVINTVVVARDLDALKHKVIGIIDLMTDDDIEEAPR